MVGVVPLVLELLEPVPDVPELELEPVPEVLAAPDVPLPDMLPDVLLGEEPLVDEDEVSAGAVLVEPVPETEVLLLGGVVVSVVDDELLLGVLVVLPGTTVVEDDELAGVEPELPVLLQPVAATEASAITATRGIRRFMTSSPIWFTCVEDKGVGWFRCVGAK